MKFYWLCVLLHQCQLPLVLAQVTCLSSISKNKKQMQVVISADKINDGYCDCPLDGLDEPDTEACSGALVGGWAGFPATLYDG